MNDRKGVLQYADPHSWSFYKYGEDDEGEPLYSFWMNLADDTGVCIYDRTGGQGMWLSTDHDPEEYDAREPSEDLKQCFRDSIGDGPGVEEEDVEALVDYERAFFGAVYGTIIEKGKCPHEVLVFIGDCVDGEVHLE